MKSLLITSVLSLALSLSACSGNGGGDNSNPGTSSTTSTPGNTTNTTNTTDTGTSGNTTATGSGATGDSGAGGNNGTTTGGGVGDGTSTGGTGGSNTGSTGGNVGGSNTSGGTGGGNTGGGGTSGGTVVNTAPQNVSGAPAANAQIAMDAQGNAIAVWERSDGVHTNIYYSRYAAGTWSAPGLMEDLDGDAKTPAIAMNNAGTALAVWAQPNPSAPNADDWTWARLYSPQSGWAPATIVSNKTYRADDGPLTTQPMAAIDDSGIAIALWQSSSLEAIYLGLTANVYRPGAGWGTEQILQRGYSQQPDIAMDGHGNAVVGYSHDGGGSFGAEPHAISYFAASGWGTPHKFLPSTYGGETSPVVGIDAGGTATAVWTQYENEGYTSDHLPHQKTYFSRRDAAGAWTAPVAFLFDLATAKDFDLAVATNGNAVLSWYQDDPGAPTVHAARFENGAWQSAVSLGNGTHARVAMAGDGPFMTLLQNNRAMYARYVGPGWSAPMPLDNGSEPVSDPQITGSEFATPFFLWLQPSGVWARPLP